MRRIVLHGLRALVFCAIILLIHLQAQRFQARESARSAALDVSAEQLRRFFPSAAALADTVPRAGSRDVVDADGNRLGYVLQTSPQSDHVVGFSGSTNVLMAFDTEDRILGIEVLSSGDTREHLREVLRDPQFTHRFDGLAWSEAAALRNVDGVSGATLTSLAIADAIVQRLGGERQSLRFPEPVGPDDAALLFPQVARVECDPAHGSLWHVYGASGEALGALLRTSPAADNIVGYQGPTEAFIALAPDGRIQGLAIGHSYDNDPYLGYVRDEEYFLTFFNGQTLRDLAETRLEEAGVEGVSGATMTSMAVARGLVAAAAEHLRSVEQTRMLKEQSAWRLSPSDAGTAAVIVAGLAIGLTSLRGRQWIRIPFLLLLVGYLGLVNGAMVSQAMLVGWAQSGVPYRSAAGLFLLTLAAFAVPLASRSNIYCTHLCPHGAAQQLLRNRLRWRWRLPPRAQRVLSVLPGLLLLWTIVVATAGLGFSLVDVEPFDAYVFRIAGWATITIAVVGLAVSLFIPMAYCRYGCPTGALLGYLRFHGRSDQLSGRDAVSVAGLAIALVLFLL